MAIDKNKIEAYGGVLIDRKMLDDCVRELSGFVAHVEKLLEEIKQDPARLTNFQPIAEKLVRVKGTARQLNLTKIADLAELAEEIAVKGAEARERPVVRKVVGALWDAVTTLTHMLDQVNRDTSAEASILMQRLEAALKSLGGARPHVGQDAIDELFSKNG